MGINEKMKQELGITPVQVAGGAALMVVVFGGIIGLGVAAGKWTVKLFGPAPAKSVPSVIVTPSLVDGLMPGETVVVASLPGMGKEIEVRSLNTVTQPLGLLKG